MTQPSHPGATGLPSVAPADLPDDALLLDVREPEEWAAGHAPGALNIPLGQLPARLGELPEPGDGALAVTCRTGGRSSRAVAWLLSQGVEAANLEGGMKAWQATGRPLLAPGDVAPTIR